MDAAPTTSQPPAPYEVGSTLRAARSRIPTDLLTEHLQRLCADGGPRVHRAAAEATLRRLQGVEEEGLRVLRRPAKGPLGDYQTTRRDQRQRPYTTRLYGVAPLDGSCGCPDFRSNSLGLCKHLLAVLEDLGRRPTALARIRSAGSRESELPTLRWNPKKPLTGDGDWLRQVFVLGAVRSGRVTAPWRTLLRRFRSVDGTMVLVDTHAGDARSRLALLDELQAVLLLSSSRSGDPALAACLAEERLRLLARIELQPVQKRWARQRGFRRQLFPYQTEGVERFLTTGRLLLADDMGLGKTTQAIAACFALFSQGLVRRGLLVVPASLKRQWVREWQACCDLPLELVEGTPEERARRYRTMQRGFLVANYEQLLRDVDVVRRWQPDLVLLDEAQRIKNWATRTAATVKQLEPRFRLVLTGTPFENRLFELDSILEWLDRRPLQPLWRLLPFHQLADGPGLQHLEVLRLRLSPVLLRRRRQDVLDQLPARTDTRIDVPLTHAQRDEHDARVVPIARLLQIGQRRPLTQREFLRLMSLFTEQRVIANGLAQFDFDDVWPDIQKARPRPSLQESLSMPKLAELRLLVQQVAIEQGRKLVVFSQWRRALQLAAWALGDCLAAAGLTCAFFTGAESLRRRDESIVAFHDDPSTRVLFATDAGGVGLNLQRAASACVHFDLPWNPAVLEQRVGRIWRLGQTNKVEVWSLVAEDCIESRIAEILRTKQATFSALFDGHSDEVRFDQQRGFLATALRVAGEDAPTAGRAQSAATEDRESEPTDGTDRTQQAAVPTPDVPTNSLAPARVRSLLAGLTVQGRPDGGMILQADRDSAAVLAEVLRSLAGAIEMATGEDG